MTIIPWTAAPSLVLDFIATFTKPWMVRFSLWSSLPGTELFQLGITEGRYLQTPLNPRRRTIRLLAMSLHYRLSCPDISLGLDLGKAIQNSKIINSREQSYIVQLSLCQSLDHIPSLYDLITISSIFLSNRRSSQLWHLLVTDAVGQRQLQMNSESNLPH